MAKQEEAGLKTIRHGIFKSDYRYLETVGRGGFGEVFRVEDKHDEHIYAVKKVRFDQYKYRNQFKFIKRELVHNAKLAHENVVRYYHSWFEVSDDQCVSDNSSVEGDSVYLEEGACSTSSETNAEDFHKQNCVIHANQPSDIHLDASHTFEKSLQLPKEPLFDHFQLPVSLRDLTGHRMTLKDNLKFNNVANYSCTFDRDVGLNYEMASDQVDSDILVSPNSRNHEEIITLGTLPYVDKDILNSSPSELDFDEITDELSESHMNSLQSLSEMNSGMYLNTRDNRQATNIPRILELYIKMEFCESTLRLCIDKGHLEHDTPKCWEFFRQIVKGLDYIHSQRIIHRDLNPRNVFITNDNTVKIGDFGLSRLHIEEQDVSASSFSGSLLSSQESHINLTGEIGTKWYSAPEILSKPRSVYGPEVDLFSLGLIFFEMNFIPISTEQEKALIFDNLRNSSTFPKSFDQNELWLQVSLIRGLLKSNPKERLILKTLLDPSEGYLPVEAKEEFTNILQDIRPESGCERRNSVLQKLFNLNKRTRYFPEDQIERSIKDVSRVKDVFRSLAEKQNAQHISLPVYVTLDEKSLVGKPKPSYKATFLDYKGNVITLPDHIATAFSNKLQYCNIPIKSRFYGTDSVFKESQCGRKLVECSRLSFLSVVESDNLLEFGRACLILQETILVSGQSLNECTLYLSHKDIEQGLLKIYGIEEMNELLKSICSIVKDSSQRTAILDRLADKRTIKSRIPNFLVTSDTLENLAAKIRQVFSKSKKLYDAEKQCEVQIILRNVELLKLAKKMLERFGIGFCVQADLFMRTPTGVSDSGIKYYLGTKCAHKTLAEGGFYEAEKEIALQRNKSLLFLEIDADELSHNYASLKDPDVIIIFNKSDKMELENAAYLIGALSMADLVVSEFDRAEMTKLPPCKFVILLKSNGVTVQYEQDFKTQTVENKLITLLKHIWSKENIAFTRLVIPE